MNSRAACEIMEILASINASGTTVMLVTHDVKVATKTERVLFMLDGNLVAEKYLGKYDYGYDGIKAREESLSKWLLAMGF